MCVCVCVWGGVGWAGGGGGGASCLELLLMPLGGSGGMPHRKHSAFSCSKIASAWCNLIGGKLVSS